MMKSAISLLLSALLLLSPAAMANDDAKLEALKEEIKKLQQWLHSAQQESDQLTKNLRQSDIEIDKLNQQVEQTRQRLEEEQARLKKLQREQGQLHKHQEQQREYLSEQIRAAQRLGNDGPIKLLLHQNDPQKAQRMLRFFAYFNNARIERITEILAELERLDNLAELIADSQRELKQQEEKQLKNNQRLQRKKRHQETLLAKLQQSMANEKKRLSQKKKDRSRLEELLHEVQTILDSGPRSIDARPITDLKGSLPMPVRGRILQAYGAKKYPGHKKGWLMAAEAGTEVKAVHHGRIIFSDWIRGYGLVLIIDHGRGYLSLYAHNQSLFRGIGSWVNQGDVIGRVGRSGGMDFDALYFEVRRAGKTQDPAIWLKR